MLAVWVYTEIIFLAPVVLLANNPLLHLEGVGRRVFTYEQVEVIVKQHGKARQAWGRTLDGRPRGFHEC